MSPFSIWSYWGPEDELTWVWGVEKSTFQLHNLLGKLIGLRKPLFCGYILLQGKDTDENQQKKGPHRAESRKNQVCAFDYHLPVWSMGSAYITKLRNVTAHTRFVNQESSLETWCPGLLLGSHSCSHAAHHSEIKVIECGPRLVSWITLLT